MRTAAAFLEDIRKHAESQGAVTPTVRASHRNVAAHVSKAVSLLLEVWPWTYVKSTDFPRTDKYNQSGTHADCKCQET